jgi:hypothetical protein
MPPHWIDPQQCKSLAVLVESVIGPLLTQQRSPICLEMEIDLALEVPTNPHETAELIRLIAKSCIHEMPSGGDMVITACASQNGVELEFADSGCDVQQRPRTTPIAAAALGATIQWRNCPQGGAAVTVLLPRQQSQTIRKVA